MSGNTIHFDEVSIAETVVPCTRTRARVKLQVRATSKPYQPPEAQRNLPLQPYQSVEAHGYLLAEHDVGKLGPAEFGCPYEAFNVTLPVTPPPPGTYYLSVFLFAFPSQGDTWCVDARYCLEDWRGFPDAVTFGGPAPSAPGR